MTKKKKKRKKKQQLFLRFGARGDGPSGFTIVLELSLFELVWRSSSELALAVGETFAVETPRDELRRAEIDPDAMVDPVFELEPGLNSGASIALFSAVPAAEGGVIDE